MKYKTASTRERYTTQLKRSPQKVKTTIIENQNLAKLKKRQTCKEINLKEKEKEKRPRTVKRHQLQKKKKENDIEM